MEVEYGLGLTLDPSRFRLESHDEKISGVIIERGRSFSS